MGWAILFLMIAAAFGGLRLAGVRQGLLTASLAALLLGASGYALQGRPSLAGAPATGRADHEVQSLTEARHGFFGNFTGEESWLRMSEALASHGNTEDAVNLLQNAVRRYPRNAQLWVGLGNALVDHAHGMTPPADFAFERAAQLIPGHPAPRFFRDLALLRSGGDGAGAAFKDMVALMRQYPNASWRPMVEYTLIAAVMSGGRSPQSDRR